MCTVYCPLLPVVSSLFAVGDMLMLGGYDTSLRVVCDQHMNWSDRSVDCCMVHMQIECVNGGSHTA